MSTALSPPPHRLSSPHHRSPPLLPRHSSRNRLIPSHLEEPPIPPRLIGSPLLNKLTTTSAHEPHVLSQKVQSELWIDGDEFGTQKACADSFSSLPSPASSASSPSSPRRAHRRSPSIAAISRSRSHSPPPTPQRQLPPPPVPPIPLSVLATPGVRRAVVRARPVNGKEIDIPDRDHYTAPALSLPPKRKRWARCQAQSVTGFQSSPLYRVPRIVAT